jgi:hypothetical protein
MTDTTSAFVDQKSVAIQLATDTVLVAKMARTTGGNGNNCVPIPLHTETTSPAGYFQSYNQNLWIDHLIGGVAYLPR